MGMQGVPVGRAKGQVAQRLQRQALHIVRTHPRRPLLAIIQTRSTPACAADRLLNQL